MAEPLTADEFAVIARQAEVAAYAQRGALVDNLVRRLVATVEALTARLNAAEADLLMVLDVWPEARPLLDAAHRAEIRAATAPPTPQTDTDT